MEGFLNEYQDILESSDNGWMLEYYPDSDLAYGGYVYFLTFNEGEVSVQFQLADDVSVPVTSLYKMTPDDGPVLSFDTYNKYLHYFATPSASEYQGMRGDTEFKIMGKSEDDSEIYLVGKKSGNRCTLTRNDDYDPTEYLQACNVIRSELNYPTISSMAFQVGDSVGEAELDGAMGVNNCFYFAYPEDGTIDSEDEVMIEGGFPFCTTPEGIRLYQPIVIDDSEYDFFYFDGDKNVLVTEDDYVSIIMSYIPMSEQLPESVWYIARKNLSPAAAALFSQSESALAEKGDAIEYLALGTGLNKGKTYGLQFTCTNANGTFGLNTTAKASNKIGFKYTMKGDGDQSKYVTTMKMILECFGRLSEKVYTITTDNFKNPTYVKLTDATDATISITLVKEKTLY